MYRALWSKMKNDPFHKIKGEDMEDRLTRVCQGKGAFFVLPYQYEEMNIHVCKLVAVDSGYHPTPVALITKTNFPFRRQFSFV